MVQQQLVAVNSSDDDGAQTASNALWASLTAFSKVDGTYYRKAVLSNVGYVDPTT